MKLEVKAQKENWTTHTHVEIRQQTINQWVKEGRKGGGERRGEEEKEEEEREKKK